MRSVAGRRARSDRERCLESAACVSSNRRPLLALLFVVLGALYLRGASVERLLPEFREPDAFETLEMQFQQGDPAIVKHVVFHERYPWLLAWTLALWPHSPAPADAGLEQHLELAAEPYVRVRWAVSWLAVLQVGLVYFLARRFLAPYASVLAAFLVSTSLLQLLFSVQARPHGAHAGFALLALIAALRCMEAPSLLRATLATLASTAAIATLQLGYSTLPPLCLAGLCALGKGWRWRLSAALLMPLCAVLAAQAWYTNRPYIDAEGLHLASAQGGGHTLFLSQMDFLGSWRGARMFFEHDPGFATLAAAGLAGVLVLAWPRWKAADAVLRRQVLLALGFAVPYLSVITIQGEVYERFMIPLLPFAALLAAYACCVLWRVCGPARWVVLGLCLLPSTWTAWSFARIAQAPNGYEQAAAWVQRHVEPSERIITTPDLSLPLLYSSAAISAGLADGASANMPWISYQATIPALPASERRYEIYPFPAKLSLPSVPPDRIRMREWLWENQARYLVVEVSQRNARRPILGSLEQAAAELGQLVFRSQGSGPALVQQGSLDYQAIEQHALRQWDQDCAGPQLRIYRLRQR